MKYQHFPHPRHDFRSSQSIVSISLEKLNQHVSIKGQQWLEQFLENKNIVVISCFDEFYTYDYLFGDYLDFDRPKHGLYSAPEFQPAFDAIRCICDSGRYCFVITPQPQSTSSFFDNDRLFHLEIPEFYGVYSRWFDRGYDSDPDINLQKHFLFLNKRNRPGRQLLFYLVYNSGMLSKSYASFLGHGPGLKTKFDTVMFIEHDTLIKHTNSGIDHVGKDLQKILPYSSDSLLQIHDDTMGTGGWLPDHRLYEQSFLSVIGETHESSNGATIFTEKIFRTIWFRRPFLVLGGAGYLRELRKLGFQTFDQWIDESYDLEPSLFARAHMIHREMVKLATLSIKDCRNLLYDMHEVLDYNRQHLRRLDNCLVKRLADIDKFILSKDVHRQYQKPCLRLKPSV